MNRALDWISLWRIFHYMPCGTPHRYTALRYISAFLTILDI
jgi:hypothetical protein